MFEVGDKVVYPVHGAGIIEAIENQEVLGRVRSYYILKISAGDMRLMVPVETVETVGMRQIIAPEIVDNVLAVLRENADELEENWNRRYRANMEKIKSGDIFIVAAVVRNLVLRDRKRGLSAGEKKMLDYAKRILVSELMLVENESEEQVLSTISDLFADHQALG
ncbi:MAG: CarD family transcriptional regulator [Clostridia bacterium]|nr:CarD family transcriptional regulator [Clostridia bacterium]MDD4798312.1 CarD family transcriptional regulator [Clostridia bacterium]